MGACKATTVEEDDDDDIDEEEDDDIPWDELARYNEG
jgi:hypothetical protein